MVWEGRRVSQHKTETFVTAKHPGLHFAPLNSGFQALQGFNIAKCYRRWGTVGCWRTTGLWFSKGKKKKRSIRRAVLMPQGKLLLVLLDRKVLGACEANDLMKVKALWWLTCDVNNVLKGVYKGRAAFNNLLCIISRPIVPSGMLGHWVRCGWASALASSLPGHLWGGSVPCLQEMQDKGRRARLSTTEAATAYRLSGVPGRAGRGCATCPRPKDTVFCLQACPAFTVALFFLVV